jgi:ABC-type phosphate transport system substrate-binding protein
MKTAWNKWIAAASLAAMAGWPAARAGEVYVVANANVNLTGAEVRDVYLGDKQLAGAVKLVPLDNAAAQKDFLDKVVKVDAGKYAAVWAKKGFRDGLNPPMQRSGDAEILAIVRNTSGAIGYVTSKPVGVKIIEKY